MDIDRYYKARGYIRDFPMCGWRRGADFVSDLVVSRLLASPSGEETLNRIAEKEKSLGIQPAKL